MAKAVIKKIKKQEEEQTVSSKFDISKFQEIYEFDTKLPGCGLSVRFKPLKTGQIKKLLAFENEKDPMIISELLNRTLKDIIINNDKIDIHEIFLKDRAFLLWEMRNKTKGGRWETQYKCEKCGSQNLLVVNLEEFPVKELDLSNVDYIIEVLPGVKIEMRFLKVIDELESLHFIDEKMTDTQKQAELFIVLQSAGINKIIKDNEVFDNLNLVDKKYFVEEMPTVVYEKISKWYVDNDYGVDTKVKHKCMSCNNELEFEVTPDNFFF